MEKEAVQHNMPVRLGKRPIVDAVFELRVRSQLPLSSILPGLIYTSLKADSIEQLPAMQIPKQVRDMQPDLAFTPLFRISWGQHWVFVGDSVLSVSSKLPYSGWENFKAAITGFLDVVCNGGYVSSIERCSMKYVDLLQVGDEIDRFDIFDLELSVGGKRPGKEGYQVRIEFSDSGIHHVLQVVSQAHLDLIGVGLVEGAIFDADLVMQLKSEVPSVFLENIDSRLEQLHAAAKGIFFSSLTEQGLAWLEPEYA